LKYFGALAVELTEKLFVKTGCEAAKDKFGILDVLMRDNVSLSSSASHFPRDEVTGGLGGFFGFLVEELHTRRANRSPLSPCFLHLLSKERPGTINLQLQPRLRYPTWLVQLVKRQENIAQKDYLNVELIGILRRHSMSRNLTDARTVSYGYAK
jgi:hypothetical protein